MLAEETTKSKYRKGIYWQVSTKIVFPNLVISYNLMEETKLPRPGSATKEASHQHSLSGPDSWLSKKSGYYTLDQEKITESKRPKKDNIRA